MENTKGEYICDDRFDYEKFAKATDNLSEEEFKQYLQDMKSGKIKESSFYFE